MFLYVYVKMQKGVNVATEVRQSLLSPPRIQVTAEIYAQRESQTSWATLCPN